MSDAGIDEDFFDVPNDPTLVLPEDTTTNDQTEPSSKPSDDIKIEEHPDDIPIENSTDTDPLSELDTQPPIISWNSLQNANITTDDLMEMLDEALFNNDLEDYERDVVFKSTAVIKTDLNGTPINSRFVSNYTRCEPYTHGIFKSLLGLPKLHTEDIGIKDEHIEYYVDSEEFTSYTKTYDDPNIPEKWIDYNNKWYETSWNMTVSTDYTSENSIIKMNDEYYICEIRDSVLVKSGSTMIGSSMDEFPILILVKKDFREITIYVSNLILDSSTSKVVGYAELAYDTDNLSATMDAVLQWKYFENIDKSILKAPQDVIDEVSISDH